MNLTPPSRSRRRRRFLLPAIIAVVTLLATSCDVPDGLSVDESRLPAANRGFSGPRISTATYAKQRTDGVGAMRINCSLSHMNFDDPIVFPGRQRVTHLHAYFGNTRADYRSNSSSIRNSGNSTCTGGTVNRSAYWAPAMIDTRTNRPVLPWGANGLQVYYKSGYRGVPSSQVRAFPAGLRMIAGVPRATKPRHNGVVTYHCDRTPSDVRVSFPNCRPGDRLVMAIEFPQCWDGRNLDSPDHKSHMAYGRWGVGCPSSHPVPLTQITQNFRYPVPSTGMSTWRLASDMYRGNPGHSGHADWWNGWDEATYNRVLRGCMAGGFDCSMNLLGDGQMLY